MQILRTVLAKLVSRIRVAPPMASSSERTGARGSTSKPEPVPLPQIPARSPLLDLEAQVYAESRAGQLARLHEKVKEFLDQQMQGPVCCPECELVMESTGRPRGRSLQTGCGKFVYDRRVYRCPRCGLRRCPVDEVLGVLPKETWSPWCSARLVALATVLPFAPATRMVKFLLDIVVSPQGLWKLAGRVGQRQYEFTEAQTEAYADPARCPDNSPCQSPELVQVGVDGAMILMRPGQGGMPRQESDDPLEEPVSRCSGREVKTAVIYLPGNRFRKGKRAHLVRKSIVSVMDTADHIFARLWATLLQENLLGTETLVAVIGDGAKWIWDRAAMFPRRIEILDFWHAAEHAWKCARAVFGEKSKRTQLWARRLVRTIRQGNVLKVIGQLKALESQVRTRSHKEAVEKLRSYYEQHATRMDYPRYRRLGLSIGSGATESVHKQLTHVRMRQAGMRWSLLGAQRMIALRLSYLRPDFGRFESFVSRAA